MKRLKAALCLFIEHAWELKRDQYIQHPMKPQGVAIGIADVEMCRRCSTWRYPERQE